MALNNHHASGHYHEPMMYITNNYRASDHYHEPVMY